MANEKALRLDEFLGEHPELKGKWIGFKYSRGGMGVSRSDNDWWECDEYYISADALIEFLEWTPTDMNIGDDNASS